MTDRVLVTGGSGFVGGHLVEHLARTREVEGWVRTAPPPGLEAIGRWRRVDLLDRDATRAAIRDFRPALVYHCAGLAHVGASWTDTARPLAGNVLGTHNLLEALRLAGVASRVLVPGSAAVYAPASEPLTEDHPIGPASPYALSKLAQEQLARRAGREDGIEIVLTRSFNHTGPRQSPAFAAPSIARQIALIEAGAVEPVMRVGNLEPRRDLTDIRDVVRAYVALMEKATPGTIYNVGSGVGYSIRTLLDALLARCRVAVRVETDPALLRPNDLPMVVADPTRLREATGWRPEISFDRMLDDLLAYWRRETKRLTGG